MMEQLEQYHRKEGGFYWHHEWGNYYSYHWPGFSEGDAYEETEIVWEMRNYAFQIRKIVPPEIPKPESPILHPILPNASMSWKGSTGAGFYTVERAENEAGPWNSIKERISDANPSYGQLFTDFTRDPKKKYFYRIIAQNRAGFSEPSNVQTLEPTAFYSQNK